MNSTGLKTPFTVMVDAYQASMFNQIPEGMSDYQCSQLTHRGQLYPDEKRIISAGLQPFVEWLDNLVITEDDINEAFQFYCTFGASNKAPYSKAFPWPINTFRTIVAQYGGKLPICVTGLPDGTAHYVGEPSVQVWSDQKGMGELVGWVESEILPYMWQCSVVATRGRIRREKFFNLYKKLYPSLSDEDIYMMFNYKFHDFGRRGAANSLLTGYAHLINWLGTDTVDAAYWAQKYLNNNKPFGACSIPAMAHRTVTPWLNEYAAYDNMIELYGDDLVSIVADSYDFYNGCDYLANQAEKIKSKGGVLIVRPDSGDPIDCIIYALKSLDEKFTSTTNNASLKIINGAAIIQGDGVSDEDIFDRIIPAIIKEGYCPSNVAFGMGQHNHKATRNDLDTAYKTCEVLRIDQKGDNIPDHVGVVPVMKASNTQNKMSFPCPVAMNSSDNYMPRLYPISRHDLQIENTGDYVQFYGHDVNTKIYQKKNNIIFDTIRKNANDSWNKLNSTGHLDDNIYPEIKRMQQEYIERTKCQK